MELSKLQSTSVTESMLFELWIDSLKEERGNKLDPDTITQAFREAMVRRTIQQSRSGTEFPFKIEDQAPPSTPFFAHGSFIVQDLTQIYFREQLLPKLGPQEAEVLVYLIKKQGYPVTYANLIEDCWDNNFKEGLGRMYIYRLRASLTEYVGEPIIDSTKIRRASNKLGFFIPPIHPDF